MKFDQTSRLAIVIPAFNEAEAIGSVVSGITAFGSVIVVNDGSTDSTACLARAAGAVVVSHEINHGYDKALASGIEKALAEEFDFVITLDADGQHEARLIESFLMELTNGADLVIGVRDQYQRVSEKIFALLAEVLWGISDPLSGMKGYRLSKLNGGVTLCSYPSIGTELTIRAARAGWNIVQIPVKLRDRVGNSRFGAGFYPNWLIFRAMLLGIFRAKAYVVDKEVGSRPKCQS